MKKNEKEGWKADKATVLEADGNEDEENTIRNITSICCLLFYQKSEKQIILLLLIIEVILHTLELLVDFKVIPMQNKV